MDALGSYLTVEILKALGEGNMLKAGAFVAVFLVLWLELRGLKKQLTVLNDTVAKSFAAGEHRFEELEKKHLDFEHRLTVIEARTHH